ncbi:MAG TPA: hypothetical protein VNY08_19290 [Bradyrhizobium sp.]|jgi:hypothetical protein|nr:hypothetical protein [Bradyrhizobium sp.]
MAEPDGSGISARLWRLPGQLLLALINATTILVIVAAIVALVAIARINRFAENIVATLTEAVLSKVDLPQKDVLANIRNLTAEVRTLGDTLREIKTGEHPALQPELGQLKEALTGLKVSVDRLGSARSILTDEAIGQLGRTLTDALIRLRDCSSSVRQTASLTAPSPGSHLSMRHSRSSASAFFFRTAAEGGLGLSHKTEGEAAEFAGKPIQPGVPLPYRALTR